MLLSQLLHGCAVLDGREHLGLDVAGADSDSRRVTPGGAFFAVRGAREDGAAFIPNAVANGARVIVGETPPAPGCVVPWVRVASPREAAFHAACAWQGHPTRHMRVYGVTGTNGKTTTAGLLQTLLENAGHKTGLVSTVETGAPGAMRPSSNTTPGPFELQKIFAEMRAARCVAAAMEVSSHAADQLRVGGARFHAAAFTNLTQDHLDYHGDMARYLAAKQKFFELAANENPACVAVVNGDDPHGREMAAFCAGLGLRVTRFGLAPGLDITAEDVRLHADGARFTLRAPQGSVEIASRLCGRYNVSNVLCAAGMALASGDATLEGVARGISLALPRWGRLERVDVRAPFRVFVDYAHTPDALQNVLATLRETTAGRLVVVFGCGGDRDRAKRPLMGGIASRLADRVVVTSDNPRSEDPADIIRDIYAGAAKDVEVEPDRRLAIRKALSTATPGDIVLIAGKGHERGQIFATHTAPFDDRDVILEESAGV
ncbi:MAG: UDP-N-acetylmuramoyl-L-alanyl-D-glutamate--2,6-diaminopimelate ligase [Kiritimatiellaeota bacterium]|nr:UDP-N-acetylmuramoyl-L-alanyl-D-glutamate--2,6-diaminopimelate ligase [Kiritimatiellota bacterium]